MHLQTSPAQMKQIQEDKIISEFLKSLGPWREFVVIGGGFAAQKNLCKSMQDRATQDTSAEQRH